MRSIRRILFCCLSFTSLCLFGQQAELVLPVGHTSSVSTASYSTDGKFIVTASWDNTAKIWDAAEGKLLRELKGHTASLTSAIFSPDTKYVLTTSKDNTARLWNTVTGNYLFELKGHSDWVNTAAFTPDGKIIATASWDNTIRLWNATNGKLLRTLTGHTGPVNSITISRDAKYILTASKDHTARVWSITEGTTVFILKGHHDWVNTATYSPDGKYILTSSNDSTACLWKTIDGSLIKKLKGHTAAVNSAAFSTDGQSIITCSKDSTAITWLVSNANKRYVLKKHTDAVTMAFFSKEGKYIATASKDNTAIIWETATGKIIQTLEGHTSPVNDIQWSSDGKYILTASADNTSRIWQVNDGIVKYELKGHTSVVTSAQFSPDGKYLVTASWDNTAKIWDATEGRLLSNLKGHTDWVNTATFSPDGKYVLTASSDNTAKLWSAADGKMIHSFEGHTDWVSAAIFSPDSKFVITSSWDNTARVWNTADGKMVNEMKGHTGTIKSVTVSPDGKYIATASWDNTAKVWDTFTGKLIYNLTGHTDKIRSAVFSPDNKYILTASWDSTAMLWNVGDGKLLYSLKEHKGPISSAAFSPDGKYIITSSMDNTANIWSTTNGKLVFKLKGHSKSVVAATYSPDGKYIVTASWDNTARIWNAEDGKLLNTLTGHTAALKSASWSPDEKYIITTSEDNTLKRWNAYTGNFLYTFFAVDSTSYLAIDKEGRYDGTEAARKMLYYVCDNEIVDIEQFKDLSWEPGLVSKLTGSNTEPITAKKISAINLCNYTPLVREKGFTEGIYRYEIIARQGGIGEVQLYVNNKLVEKYDPAILKKVNNVYTLAISQEKVKDYLVAGQYNQVLVKATTLNGTISSRGASLAGALDKKSVTDPRMFIIAAGISQYKDEKLRLKYASHDAIDFTSALSGAAQKLLNTNGSQHVFTYVFNTETGSQRWPMKAALQQLIDSIATKARSEDILIIFFAGHGVLVNGQKNFLLLTAEASSLELNGAESEISISTEELKDWLRKIKANKQMLVLDACNSGQVVQQFQDLINKRDIPADQQRALESLKDKTGTYILSASAAGQSAYETSLYNQGLLTYSLLSGIKLGGGLKDSRFIDVTRWFNYAADYVRILAKDIGGRQDPQIMGNASFVVGLVDKDVTDNIQLSIQKKIFIRSKFIQDEDLLNDDLNLSASVDKELNDLSNKGKESPLAFAADYTLSDGYSVRGRYTVTGSKVNAKISVFKGTKERVTQFDLEGSSDNKDMLARMIVRKVQEYVSTEIIK
ncbi:MAG: caspase family protein [Chitinophagaceae bacterium]